MNDIDKFNNNEENLREKPKSNFSNFATGITSIKIQENKNKRMDLKSLKNSKSGISPTKDIEDLKKIEIKKKLMSAKNDTIKNVLYKDSNNYDKNEDEENLKINEKNKENKNLKDKAKRIIEKNRINKNGNLENLNECDIYKINKYDPNTAKSYHNSKMEKILEKFSEKRNDKISNRNNKSPMNIKGRDLVQEILSGKVSGNEDKYEKQNIRKTSIDYDLDEFIQKEIFKFSENNSSKRNTPSTNAKTDKNINNNKKINKISKYENDKEDKMMDLSMDRSCNDIAIDNLKYKLNKQKDKSVINALNKTGDLVNLDNENDNSIIDNVFSKIEGKNKMRRQSGNYLYLI